MRLNLKAPFFIFLLPVFFVLHGLIENYNTALVKDAMVLALTYLGVSLLLSLLFWLLYKNFHKANLVAFSIMAFNFFFGSVHDFLKKIFSNAFIVKYSFILPLTFLVILILIIYVKKTKTTFTRTTKYLNLLFLLLILIDTVNLSLKLTKKSYRTVVNLSKDFTVCDTCSRPDIYLIIADEYAGKTTLQDIFSFSNSGFENELRNRGFHVVNNSKANYNFTVYSMASMLNMDYLKNLEQNTINHRDMFLCRDLVKDNNVLRFFKKNGYSFYNYSLFEFDDRKNLVTDSYFISGKTLIAAQTFLSRFYHDLGFHFVSHKKLKNRLKNNMYNNMKVDSFTRRIALTKSEEPKFVYAHLSMPHHPYYFDRNGKEAKYNSLLVDYQGDEKSYIEYLIYTNKKLISLIDHIKSASYQPPVIMLMSDHGYRKFNGNVDKKNYFINLNAVYLPSRNYTKWYDGMSNVNQFRTLLNTQFLQKFPLLIDTTYFMQPAKHQYINFGK